MCLGIHRDGRRADRAIVIVSRGRSAAAITIVAAVVTAAAKAPETTEAAKPATAAVTKTLCVQCQCRTSQHDRREGNFFHKI